MEGRLGRAIGAAKKFLMSDGSPTQVESGVKVEERTYEASDLSREDRHVELTPRKLDFGIGGSRVVGFDRGFNDYLARRGANFRTDQRVYTGGNMYAYGFVVGGRLVITPNENYIYKIKPTSRK